MNIPTPIVIATLLSGLVSSAWSAAPVDPRVEAINKKIDIIESGKAKPGEVFVFNAADFNVWVRAKVPTIVPAGIREPKLEMRNNSATGSALIDFVKVRVGAGESSNWLIDKLIEGEKPVKVSAHMQSAHGRGTVTLDRVEIGGLAVSGATLDFLIKAFFMPLYPNAKINKPFKFQYGIDHIDTTPTEARVYMRTDLKKK